MALQRQYRLKKDVEFKQVRSKGRSWANSSLVLYALPGPRNENGIESVTRIGISVSKRIGKAVKRNRVKRLIREAVRLRLPGLRSGWSLLFIARKPVADASFAEVQEAIDQLIRRAGLLAVVRTEAASGSQQHGREEEREKDSVEAAARLEVGKEAENRPRNA